MTSSERRLLLLMFFIVAVVFAFLFGFVVAEFDWFKPARESLYEFLKSIGL